MYQNGGGRERKTQTHPKQKKINIEQATYFFVVCLFAGLTRNQIQIQALKTADREKRKTTAYYFKLVEPTGYSFLSE